MIYESIRQFLGSQNFALVSANVPEVCILRNTNGSQAIFCVIADNTRTRVYSYSQLSSVAAQLSSMSASYGCTGCDVLFIVITGDTARDRSLAASDLKVWLADASDGGLIIYENQPSDFYGLRYGIEKAAVYGSHGQAGQYRQDAYGNYYHSSSSAAGQRSAQTSRASLFLKNFPYVTVSLIALNVIYFIILAAMDNPQSTSFMASMGANYSAYIFEDFQLWRLVSCMFMHFGISHLLSNMIYLAIVGYNLERIAGHVRFLLIYMLAGIGSSVVSAAYYYITDTPTLSAGASGAIYGLVGAMCTLTFRNFRTMRPVNLFWRIGMIIVFVFYSSFVSNGVDGAAHVGGFIFGIILGLTMLKPRRAGQ